MKLVGAYSLKQGKKWRLSLLFCQAPMASIGRLGPCLALSPSPSILCFLCPPWSWMSLLLELFIFNVFHKIAPKLLILICGQPYNILQIFQIVISHCIYYQSFSNNFIDVLSHSYFAPILAIIASVSISLGGGSGKRRPRSQLKTKWGSKKKYTQQS